MALTKIQAGSIEPGAINTTDLGANVTATYATYAAVAANLTPRITTVNVANSSYTVLDDTSVNTAGGYLVITGANFQSGAIVTIDTTQATSTTYVTDTTLRAQVAAKNAGSYTVYVQNPDGGTAIRVNGVTFSNTPVWGTAATLSNQAANTAFGVSISANSDSAITYSNTTALPAGTTLLSNGYFYGTVTIGAETVYSFDVKANDAENQDNTRTFSLTVTVTPQYQLYTWGHNNNGQLGLGDIVNRSSPVQVGSGTTWSNSAMTEFCSAFIKSDGTLWVCGSNNYGELGLNDRVLRSSPVQVGSGTTWSNVSLHLSMMALKTNGTLWLWGYNNYGQLGLNDKVSRSSPVQVGSGTDWSKISTSTDNFSAFAIKTGGTIWAWGRNSAGNLGLNDRVDKSSPVQIGSGTDWADCKALASGGLALKTGSTIWAWGQAALGTLGLNDSLTNRSSPTQIGTGTNWSKISGDFRHALAIKSDGTLWAWGWNNKGQLGNGDYGLTYKSSPVQIGSATTWSLISASRYNSGAIKTDGTLWVWGSNATYGQLALTPSTTHSVSPIQIGTSTKWTSIYASYSMTGIRS